MSLQVLSRRQTLASIGVIVGVAGCAENEDEAPSNTEDDPDESTRDTADDADETDGPEEAESDPDSDPDADGDDDSDETDSDDVGDDEGVTVTLDPATAEVETEAETSVEVVINNATDGIGAYEFTVSVATPDVASITTITEARGDGPGAATVSDDGTTAAVERALLGDAFDPAAEVSVATVEIIGETTGTTELTVGDVTVGDNDGVAYTVSGAESASLDVS